MEVKVNRKEFSDAFFWVKRAIADKPYQPILGYLKLKADKESLRLEGSNQVIHLSQVIPASVEHTGEFLVDISRLKDLLPKVKCDALTLSIEPETFVMTVETDNGSYGIPVLLADDYPCAPTNSDIASLSTPITVKASELAFALSSTLYATAKDETKGSLTGIRFRFLQDQLEFGATDTYQIAIATLEIENLTYQLLVIPAIALATLSCVLPKTEDGSVCEINFTEKFVTFSYQDRVLTFLGLAQYSQPYPKLEQILAADYETMLTCDRTLLIEAVSRVDLFTDRNIVRFVKSNEKIVLFPHGEGRGEGKEELEVVFASSSKDEFLLNTKYLVECLKVIACKEVAIAFSPTSPLVKITSTSNPLARHYLFPLVPGK